MNIITYAALNLAQTVNKVQIRVQGEMPSYKRKRQAAAAIQARWSKSNSTNKTTT